MEYISSEQFMNKFGELWSSCKTQFFKLEVLPEYTDFDIEDWSKVDAVKAQSLISKVQKDIYEGKSVYDEKVSSGMEILRVRYMPNSLTKYILIELSGYATAQTLGAKFQVLEDKGKAKIDVRLQPFFGDFLLFDDSALLRIDNPNGNVDSPGYFTNDIVEMEPYISLKNAILTHSCPLDDYMKNMNLQFVQTIPGDGTA